MNDLDAAAAKANNLRMTPEARKAEKKRLAAEKKAASKAKWAKRWASFATGWRIFWDFIQRNVLLTIAAAVCCAASIFDWWMNAKGWLDLLPGLGVFAYFGAAGAVGFWYVAFRRFREELRAKDGPEAVVWGLGALAAYLLCVIGLFVGAATNQVDAQRKAQESRKAFIALVVERDDLQGRLRDYGVDFWEAALAVDENSLASQIAIARGTFGMPDLDLGGACSKKLSFDQRRACVHANGGQDPHTGEAVKGIRIEIQEDKDRLRHAHEQADRLEALNKQISGYVQIRGDETQQALAQMFDAQTEGSDTTQAGGKAMGFTYVIAMMLFMFVGGLILDWVLEKTEAQRKAAAAKWKSKTA